jgi:hypothetical protein
LRFTVSRGGLLLPVNFLFLFRTFVGMMTLLVDVAVATFNVRESLVSAWGVSVDSGLERFLNKGVELGLIEVSKKIGLKNNPDGLQRCWRASIWMLQRVLDAGCQLLRKPCRLT